MTRKIELIGGGPAGLYAARLLKLKDPGLQVTVHERLSGAAETFGFGVGLTESTMRNLAVADPATAEQVRAASHAGHDLRLKGHDATVTLHGARNLAIGRAALLEILGAAATEMGVEIRRGSEIDAAQLDADVVIAADGVRSRTREKYATELGVHSSPGRTRFVWCGADFAVESAFFAAAQRGEDLFVLHAYPYGDDRSTFLIEVDDLTWQSAGLRAFDARTPIGETDHASVALLEGVFAAELRGRRLLTNRTRWGRFTNLTLERWSTGNVVLLGDAAHTAHYTLGSGTKLALEDAIALAEALAGESSIAAALAAYEAVRRPPVERFTKLAHRSQAWWDTYRLRVGLPAERLALSYMTRSGNLTLTDYAAEQLASARRALAWLGDAVPDSAADLDEWVLSRPLAAPGLTLPTRLLTRDHLSATTAVREVAWSEPDVWGEPADALIAALARSGSLPVLLSGPATPEAVAARIDLGERLRLEGQGPVGVFLGGDGDRAAAATAVAAARADFVVTT
ncbi:FAD-dependent monooxygenase [Nonomuraea indica]|uniref:FAD-dependent monooxygenase n=1 Tax=Nonomuraea indica TaxID=1581193 RepID=A0ABW8A4C9_9ACTN